MHPEKIRKVVEEITIPKQEGYLIVRVQSRREITIKFNNGKVENISTGRETGMGVQAFTMNGASGFSSANTVDRLTAENLAQKALTLAKENERIGSESNIKVFSLSPNREDLPNQAIHDFAQYSPEELQNLTGLIHQRLQEIHLADATIAWQTSYRQIEDYWCIGRTDGTLVSFYIPRAVLFHQGTVKQGDQAQSFSVHRSGIDVGVLLTEEQDQALHRKAIDKAILIQKVCTAPTIPSGSYPLIIDYGLAKGLAHEAFGHAVESDLAEESVLSEKGKLQTGLIIASQEVDIIDGSMEGDWAYQPYSANGEKRQTVAVVQAGVLRQGLGDVFSADKAGIKMTGAGRAEYYGAIPLPRMTNIRLVSSNRISLPESQTLTEEIETMRRTLESEGRLEKDGHYLLLGYRGGQVNIKTGDFVFQCDGAVNLADPSLKTYKPGIFSGKILSVLASVGCSLGQEKYDAIGTCGKGGQLVASSGGGSGYICLSKNENVRIGGHESVG